MKSIAAAYEHWLETLPAIQRERINSGAPVYVFGRTENSAIAAKHANLSGVIDDFAPGTTWNNLPVIHGDDVPAQAIVISTILHRVPSSLKRLETFKNKPTIIHYCDFVRAGLPPLERTMETHRSYFGNENAFANLYSRLDTESRKVFHDVMLFRLTGDAAFMANYPMREQEQYFDIPLPLPAAPIFADGGAYKGETTQEFCRRWPNYGGSHIFEPVPASIEAARKNLTGYHNMHFHSCALGDHADEVFFDTSSGTSSHVTKDGSTKIRIARLDDEIEGRVDFIKYDLEGYEPKALAGAARIIRDHHPALAICVYHMTSDFLNVPAEVFKIRDDYTIALRHYTQGWNETVMYFIPKGRT